MHKRGIIIIFSIFFLVYFIKYVYFTKSITVCKNSTFKINLLESCFNSFLNKCSIVPPLIAFEKRFRTAPNHKLNFCAIEKNLSTILTGIICFLFNEENFRQHNRSIIKEEFNKRYIY